MRREHQDGLAMQIFQPCLLRMEGSGRQQRRQKKQ
jgi:hypothetical protein